MNELFLSYLRVFNGFKLPRHLNNYAMEQNRILRGGKRGGEDNGRERNLSDPHGKEKKKDIRIVET